MEKSEILEYYRRYRDSILFGVEPQSNPKIFILGGQPGAGKSSMIAKIKTNEGIRFFSIDGDKYRIFHPQFKELVQQPERFSSETQAFSNLFVEELLKDCAKKRISVSVEGTMKNPEIPLKTANMFRKLGYITEAHIIAETPLVSKVYVFKRFDLEMKEKGVGRLSDMSVHDMAVVGVLKSSDELYKNKAVDRICLYSEFGKFRFADYRLQNGKWNIQILPSEKIKRERNKQEMDLRLMKEVLKESELLVQSLIDKVKVLFIPITKKLESIVSELEKVALKEETDEKKSKKLKI